MRALTLSLLLLLVLAGCAVDPGGGGGQVFIPGAITQRSEVQGSGTIGSIFIGAFAWTYPIRWSGEGTLTIQYPAQPHIILDGNFVWEPVYPEQREAIQREIALGNFRP
jgi:hypothetical protein